jgi:hypothetical protein
MRDSQDLMENLEALTNGKIPKDLEILAPI